MTAPILSIVGILLASASASVMTHHGGAAVDSGMSQTQAAAALLSVVHVAQAVQLHDVQEGIPYQDASLRPLVESRYLKAIPPNPTGAGHPALVMEDGERVVAMPLGGRRGVDCDGVRRLLERVPASDMTTGCTTIDGVPSLFVRI